MGKTRTTINIDEELLLEIEESGVKNVSAYLRDLARVDLNSLRRIGKRERERQVELRARLEAVAEEWRRYEARVS